MDIQAQLRAAFAIERTEHLAALRAALAVAARGEAPDLKDMFRRAHSLKGAARAADAGGVEDAAHMLESLLSDVTAGVRALDAATIAEVAAGLDRIEDARPDGDAPEVAPAEPADDTDTALLRVSGEGIERLARSIAGLGVEMQGIGSLATTLRPIEAELRAAARTLAGDPELAGRLERAAGGLGRLMRERSATRNRLDRLLGDLERDVDRVMRVPAALATDGLGPMVRQLAEAAGKAVTLRIEGGSVTADRRVLQALRDPLTHALSNAVDHGLETREARRAAGKPEAGTITVAMTIEGRMLVVRVCDDGRGLDPAAIAARARRLGLWPADGPDPDVRTAAGLLFAQGLSTADRVGRVSGRGVGLSVVAEAARRLHGEARIAPAPDGGTVLTIAVPLALTRAAVLLVEAGGETLGIPADAVERLVSLPSGPPRTEGGRAVMPVDGETLPLVSLAALIGLDGSAADGRGAVLLAVGERRLLLAVDRLAGVSAKVAHDPTEIAAASPLVHGTIVLEDGQVAILLSPARLAERAAAWSGNAIPVPGAAPAGRAKRQRTVLVVDDSITTRTLERSILEASGYRVLIAVDGIDGLQRLREAVEPIDLVIADVEMPRMDGFGLLAAIRNDPGLTGIPVVMMTSRNSPDDIQRGLDLGADAYQTKQDFDQGGLLATIGRLI